MTTRPRPVTATVTKPRWMAMPDADAIARARRHSLGSTGSTASLVSVLDHDSYMSVPSDSELEAPKVQLSKRSPRKTKGANEVTVRKTAVEDGRKKSSDSMENGLSPWEVWLITKTQEERKLRQQEIQRKKQEKLKKTEEAKEKEKKQNKTEGVLKEWIERKKNEEMLRRGMEKLKTRSEKQQKEKTQINIQQKAAENFVLWKKQKSEEEREKKKSDKLKKLQEEEEKRQKADKAEKRYKEWCKNADRRPKSAPNSFGYMEGKLKGYHDTAAYPTPSFYNPLPWQPIHIPRVKNEKPKKSKPKKYVWNPNKYY
ncbi:LOW QUALITY PROTEIN: coiled-coil domain-containing protein 34-like [Haliotis rubra]|uniref:LOW QUALITY PROTEIN: coiled-coil domain-containing protein 34-like n=1 Tax=Haliotis rubra TaxID=36100 RepID=UPI001EE51603|nr:LOW QUALITY PROTEIN: coiled-coil domain-containing protein 34-like [Haliotis rubra]